MYKQEITDCMEKIDPFDDLALAKKPYKVVAALPIQGRRPLLKQTITRLYKKNGCFKVICAGEDSKDKKLCESLGAVWVHALNQPTGTLGLKWNRAFLKAKEYNPDAVLYVGSSDWLSDNWIEKTRPYVEEHGITGVPGCHFGDIPKRGQIRIVYWPGYVGERSNESIGIGRMLSKKLLDLIDWQPFDPTKQSSMDAHMKKKCAAVGYNDFFVREDIKAMSISTDMWDNMHKFEDHWSGRLPSDKIEDVDNFLKQFPEAYQIFK